MWDERDIELGLRDKLASVVASILSGVSDATPVDPDYDLADTFRVEIESFLTDE